MTTRKEIKDQNSVFPKYNELYIDNRKKLATNKYCSVVSLWDWSCYS